jgi:hypothetical protein
MKKHVVLAAISITLLCLLVIALRWSSGHTSTLQVSEAPPQAAVSGIPSNQSEAPSAEPEKGSTRTEPNTVKTNQGSELEQHARESIEAGNVPVAFYGIVEDQDSNVLQNVEVHVAVMREYVGTALMVGTRTTELQRRTDSNGRFEVSGLRGKYVSVPVLEKEGYEQDLPGQAYGSYGAQSGSFTDPVVLRMWSTNVHQPLVTGEKSFVITPDSRRYAIDLLKGTIAEGKEGDLVAWIKRPEGVTWGQKYDWACEVAVPGGGLLESEGQAMFTAPEAGYTNSFAYQEEAGISGWGVATAEKRFYVRLRSGQMYGRITIQLYADYHGKQTAMIELSYAVNPSGSRLLR